METILFILIGIIQLFCFGAFISMMGKARMKDEQILRKDQYIVQLETHNKELLKLTNKGRK